MAGKRKKKPEVVELKPMMVLPPAPDRCQVCAAQHTPELPHNKDSLYYQMSFHQKHGRWPVWEDAMAHCTEEMKKSWRDNMLAAILSKEGEAAES